MTIDEMIAVLQASKAGRQIEWKGRDEGNWQWVGSDPPFNFSLCDYRVKPEPREWMVGEYHEAISSNYSPRNIKVREVL